MAGVNTDQVELRPDEPRREAAAVNVEVLEVMSSLLLGIGEASPADAFFSSLCAAICHLTAMRRAVLFRYDAARRRVRAVGAHGLELDLFATLFVTIDSVPVAHQALTEDRVLEAVGADDANVPVAMRELFSGVRMVCTPMAAAGRHVGVVLSEREPDAPPLSDEDRHLLWTLGKTLAMASVAREVTAYHERSRQLEQRIDLAREIHDRVVQRLFGVSLVLAQDRLLDAEAQQRCAAEVQCALGDLRTALQRALGQTVKPTAATFAEELQRQRALHPDLAIVLEEGSAASVPPRLEALAQSILVEAIRNVRKHARAKSVAVSIADRGGTFMLEMRNDGVSPAHDPNSGGLGLHVATLQALQHGGVLDYGEPEPGVWQVRLMVPSEP
jgi:signal transduction histidine kinase